MLNSYPVAILVGILLGILTGLGTGGGSLLVLWLTLVLQFPPAQAKVINLTTNITSLTVFLLNGQVLLPLGLAGALCTMAGNWVGSGLAISKGAKIARPVILLVLLLLLAKILFNF